MIPVLNDRVRIFPVRPLKNDSKTFRNKPKPVKLGVGACLYVRVIDVEQPVEAHVDAQRHVDQVRVALLQPLVQAGEAGGQLGDVQQLLVLFEAVLLEDLASCWHAQEIHCREQGGGRVRVSLAQPRLQTKLNCFVLERFWLQGSIKSHIIHRWIHDLVNETICKVL